MDNRYQYYESYEDNLRYLKYYVRERADFLTEVWVGGEVYRTVTMEVKGSEWRKFYVRDGGLLGDLPVPFLNGQPLHRLVSAGRGRNTIPIGRLYEDMTLEAAWQGSGGEGRFAHLALPGRSVVKYSVPFAGSRRKDADEKEDG